MLVLIPNQRLDFLIFQNINHAEKKSRVGIIIGKWQWFIQIGNNIRPCVFVYINPYKFFRFYTQKPFVTRLKTAPKINNNAIKKLTLRSLPGCQLRKSARLYNLRSTVFYPDFSIKNMQMAMSIKENRHKNWAGQRLKLPDRHKWVFVVQEYLLIPNL